MAGWMTWEYPHDSGNLHMGFFPLSVEHLKIKMMGKHPSLKGYSVGNRASELVKEVVSGLLKSMKTTIICIYIWLVVSTPLNNISQLG